MVRRDRLESIAEDESGPPSALPGHEPALTTPPQQPGENSCGAALSLKLLLEPSPRLGQVKTAATRAEFQMGHPLREVGINGANGKLKHRCNIALGSELGNGVCR